MLHEYDISQSSVVLYCENMSAIKISKNPVQHSHTKRIDIHHHFIYDLVEDKVICLKHIHSFLQLANIFMKPLDSSIFEGLRAGIGVFQWPK